jgi:hypothetical protein
MTSSEAWENVKAKFDNNDTVSLTYEEFLAMQKDDIHVVENKTSRLYFKTKKDAESFMSQSSVTDGFRIEKIKILISI